MSDEWVPLQTPEPEPVRYAEPFWLSHHRLEDQHKCLKVWSRWVCTRCLGMYPAMLGLLAWLLWPPLGPKQWEWDKVALWALPVPALLDWSAGQLTRWKGYNALRLGSGVLLGLALGRAVYLNMRTPRHPLVFQMMVGLSAIAGVVWGIRQVLGSPASPAPKAQEEGLQPLSKQELTNDVGVSEDRVDRNSDPGR